MKNLLLTPQSEQLAELRLDLTGHGGVDGGDECQDVRLGVADHVPGQGSLGPELRLPSVDILYLLLHGVERSLVALTEGFQGDVHFVETGGFHFVDWFPGLLQQENSVCDLQWVRMNDDI